MKLRIERRAVNHGIANRKTLPHVEIAPSKPRTWLGRKFTGQDHVFFRANSKKTVLFRTRNIQRTVCSPELLRTVLTVSPKLARVKSPIERIKHAVSFLGHNLAIRSSDIVGIHERRSSQPDTNGFFVEISPAENLTGFLFVHVHSPAGNKVQTILLELDRLQKVEQRLPSTQRIVFS